MKEAGLLSAAEGWWASLFWNAWSVGHWSELSVDEREYGQRNLAQHLAAADASPERLAELVDVAWRDAWRGLDPSDEGFLADVDLIADRAGDDIALRIKCCLCRSSASSVQADMPRGLLALSVEHGLMSLDEALRRAARTPEESSRAGQFEELARIASPEVLPKLLTAAYDIDEGYPRAHALAAIAERAGAKERAHVRNAARRMAEPRDRARVLAALLPGEPLEQRSALAAELVAAADEIALDFQWREILEPASPYFPIDRLRDLAASGAGRVARAGRSGAMAGGEVARVLVAAAERLPADQWPVILDALSAIPAPFHVANALGALTPRLPAEHRDMAAAIARGLENAEARVRALKGLGLETRPEDELAALARAKSGSVANMRAGSLTGALPSAPAGERLALFQEAVAAARQASGPLDALVSVVVGTPADLRASALDIAFEALDEEPNKHIKISAALQLARGLRSDEGAVRDALRARLLKVVEDSAEPDLRSDELLGIATVMEESQQRLLLERALIGARSINNSDGQIHAFREVLPATPDALLDVAAETARAIHDERERAEALVALADRVPPAEKGRIVAEALSQFDHLLDETHEAEALVSLAAFVEGPDRHEFLLCALERLRIGAQRVRFAVGTTDPHAPGSFQDIIADALALVIDSGEGGPNDGTPARIRAAALEAAQAIRVPSWRANALHIVGRHATPEEWPAVRRAGRDLDLSAQIGLLTARASVERSVARRETLRAAIALARAGYEGGEAAISGTINNDNLDSIARLMDEVTGPEVLRLVRDIPSSWWQRQGLRRINPYLSDKQRRSARAIAKRLPPDGSGLLKETLHELAKAPPPPKRWERKHPHQLRRRGDQATESEWREALSLGSRFSEGVMSVKKTSRIVDLAARSLNAPEGTRRSRSAAVLRQLAHERRPMVLREIAILAPLFGGLYRGSSMPRAACRAIREVCSWPL